MKFSKQEKELLDIEKFFNNFKNNFPNTTYISLETVGFSNNHYNVEKKLLPLCIDVKYEEDRWALYTFLSHESDSNIDNAKAYDVNGNPVEYEKVKNTIFQLLPDFFKTKAIYNKDRGYNINNETINKILKPTKIKLSVLELNNEFYNKLYLDNKKKHKI